jgi:glucose/arabinose dehydrogenase
MLLGLVAVAFFSWRMPDGSGQTQSNYAVEAAFPNLTFNQPVGIVSSGDGMNRLFVIEQAGVIRVFENSRNVAASSVFLNISSRVVFGGEQGLLGLAFHPNYASNGYFYVDYVADNPLRTVIARYSVDPNNMNQALSDSEIVLFNVNQPFANHKGGQISFGADGYLYIGLGDGGSAGDPFGNGQNRSTLLGKILRIDVDSSSQGRNYGIPPDNPFAGNILGYREEIYAYGFRNPWRFSFDPPTERLWVADVGQDQREEIDLVEKGKNYGWNIMEGTLTYSSGSQVGLELPVWEYSHAEGNAVIGGYVYRGSTLTGLYSKYVFGDYGSGKVWALQYDGVAVPTNTLLADTGLNISSFGVDEQNELYFTALNGKIYVLANAASTPLPTTAPSSTPTATSSANTTLSPTPTIPEFPSAIISIAALVAVTAAMLLCAKKQINNRTKAGTD